MSYKSLIALFLLVGTTALAQPMNVTRIVPVEVTARVVGVLEGNQKLAVLYVTKVDSNDYLLEANMEILTYFQFGTKPNKGEMNLPGVKSGDMIVAEVAGKKNKNSGQMDYTVLRYHTLDVTTIKKTSAEVDDSPQK